MKGIAFAEIATILLVLVALVGFVFFVTTSLSDVGNIAETSADKTGSIVDEVENQLNDFN